MSGPAVCIAALDRPALLALGEAASRILRGAAVEVTQDPDSDILTLQAPEGRTFAVLPLCVNSASTPVGAPAPSVTVDPLSGVATLTAPDGSPVEVMGAPPDFRQFLDLLAPLGVTGVAIERGLFTAQTANPNLIGVFRLGFETFGGGGSPRVESLPDGTARLTYPGGRTQMAFPVFEDLTGLLEFLPAQPGVGGAEPHADGTVSVLFRGESFRLRPAFTVGPPVAGTTPQIIRDGTETFSFTGSDGRSQSLTVRR